MRMHFGAALLAAGLSVAVIGSVVPRQASAQSVVVGTVSKANCLPFGCNVFEGVSGYQQVFSGSLFGGPVLINQFGFFTAEIEAFGTPVFNSGTYAFSLGYSAAAVGALSTDLPSNFSSTPTLFASVNLSGVQPDKLAVPGTPFFYDPSLGNLLLDIGITNRTENGTPDFEADTPSTCSRAFNISLQGSPANGADGTCLVTEIDYTDASVASVVPEPATLSLLATGLVGVLGAGIKRRKKA